jgi:hypothetical protein
MDGLNSFFPAESEKQANGEQEQKLIHLISLLSSIMPRKSSSSVRVS